MGRLSPLLQWAFLRLLNTSMEYVLHTLVDITATGKYRSDQADPLLRHQQQNFDTVTQTIGMRANLIFDRKPELAETTGSHYGLPTDELVKVWTFRWSTEQQDIFNKDGDPTGLLKQDFQYVTYIQGLTESKQFSKPIFITVGSETNIIFKVRE
jgi:hypothetical protein